ncbi:hypothetical protein V8E36_004312 [Tilletia maclaganii]
MFGHQAKKIAAVESSPLTAGMARQLAVYWVTEASRPISIVEDKGFRALLNEQQLSVMPKMKTVSRDITKVFKGMRKHLIAELAKVQGCFHIAIDVWTSANGHAFLVIIIFYQQEGSAVRRVVELVPFDDKHDAKNLSDIILRVTNKYGVTSRIWNVISDNASENNALMPLLAQKGGLPRYDLDSDNLSCRVRCCAHVLNLITKAVLKGFVTKRGASGGAHDEEWDDPATEDQSNAGDSSDSEAEDDDIENEDDDEEYPTEDEDDFCFSASLNPEKLVDQDDDAQVDQILAAAKENEEAQAGIDLTEKVQREVEKRNKEVGQVIKKVAWLAVTLRRSGPKSREFKRHCVKMGCPTPHNMLRDVATRWDSTVIACERALHLFEGIISFSEQPDSPVPRAKRLRRANKDELSKLIQLLKPISQAKKKFSEMAAPTIGDVIGLFEDIDKYFIQIEEQDTGDDDLVWKQAAGRGHVVGAKYYGLTEQANVISIATLLHPNFRKHALTMLKWPEEWKEQAEQQLLDVYHLWYAIQPPPNELHSESQVADFEELDSITQQLILLHQTQAQQANSNPDQAIDDWLKEPITPLGSRGDRFDPLRWWWREHQRGNERATSVDAERLFSRAGRIGEIVTLGKWFAEGSVPEDLLVNIIDDQKKSRTAQ